MAMKITNFQGLNKFKPMKKGIFFTIDSLIAAGIILIVIIYASSFYVREQPSFNLNFFSQDMVSTLSTLNVVEIDNVYINKQIDDNIITDLDNTVLKQIGEFWASGDLERANKTASNVTDLFLPSNIGFGIWIDNESIYNRDVPIEKSLVSTKKILSGIEKGQTSGETRDLPPKLLGPAIVEVRVWN